MNLPHPDDAVHLNVRTTSQPCQIHKKHIPESHINHRHHVWPIGEGGPDVSDNIIIVCPTGHGNLHDLLNQFKMLMGRVPYTILRRYTIEERKYAELGYDRITRKSL